MILNNRVAISYIWEVVQNYKILYLRGSVKFEKVN